MCPQFNVPLQYLFNQTQRRLGIPRRFGLRVYTSDWFTIGDNVDDQVQVDLLGKISDHFIAVGVRCEQLMPQGAPYPIDKVQRCKVQIQANAQNVTGAPGMPAMLFHDKWIDELYPLTGPFHFYGRDDDSQHPESPIFLFTRVLSGAGATPAETGAKLRVSVLGFHPDERYLIDAGYYSQRIHPVRWLAGFDADRLGLPPEVSLRFINGGPVTLGADVTPVAATVELNWRGRANLGFLILGAVGYEYDATGNEPMDQIRRATVSLTNNKETLLSNLAANLLWITPFDYNNVNLMGPLLHQGDSDYSPYLTFQREQEESPKATRQYCVDVLGYYEPTRLADTLVDHLVAEDARLRNHRETLDLLVAEINTQSRANNQLSGAQEEQGDPAQPDNTEAEA